MANQEQLDILKQGVDVWNKWREKNSAIEINLVGVDLRMVILWDARIRREISIGKRDLIQLGEMR